MLQGSATFIILIIQHFMKSIKQFITNIFSRNEQIRRTSIKPRQCEVL